MKSKNFMFCTPFKTRWFIGVISLALFFVSCEKNLEVKDSLEVSGTTDVAPNEYFDWETEGIMPHPPGGDMISSPFIDGGTISGYEDDIVDDYRKIDGWEMVYSTFSYTVNLNINTEAGYFVLYNRYRGMLRVYLRVPNIGVTASDYLQYGIEEKDAANYKYLNLDNKEIIDPNEYIARSDNMQASTLASNAWYMLQYEIGYDTRPVISTDYPPTFWFYVNAINITDIKINGTTQGDFQGTLGSSSTSSAFTNIFKSVTTNGINLGTKTANAIGKESFLSLKQDSKINYVDKIIDGALGAIGGNLPGSIINVLSAVVGGSTSTSAQPIKLTMSGTLELAGEMKDEITFPGTPLRKYLPGTVAPTSGGSYQVLGQVPLYNKRLGVFNLEGRPKICEVGTPELIIENGVRKYLNTYTYTKNDSEITNLLKFNPEVINSSSTGAQIQDLTYEIVIESDAYSITPTYVSARKEYTSLGMVYTSQNTFTVRWGLSPRPILGIGNSTPMVRISFRVVPNNGAPATTIVKTFVADLVKIPF